MIKLIDRRMPVCVDLDGTLIKRNAIWKVLVSYFANGHFCFKDFFSVKWTSIKYTITEKSSVDVSSLLYRANLIDMLKNINAPIFLVTGSPQKIASDVGSYLGIFEAALGSSKYINLVGKKKAEKLVEMFGEKGFVYIGNSFEDIHVWRHAKTSIVITRSKLLLYLLRKKMIRFHLFC